MQLKIIPVENIKSLDTVLLFTEDKPEDYVFSHLLSLVVDKEDENDFLQKSYKTLPDSTLVTERGCHFQIDTLSLLGGFTDEGQEQFFRGVV